MLQEDAEVIQEERLFSQSPAGSEESGALYRRPEDPETAHGLRPVSSLFATDIAKYPRLGTWALYKEMVMKLTV